MGPRGEAEVVGAGYFCHHHLGNGSRPTLLQWSQLRRPKEGETREIKLTDTSVIIACGHEENTQRKFGDLGTVKTSSRLVFAARSL